jgi:hypothetical protein
MTGPALPTPLPPDQERALARLHERLRSRVRAAVRGEGKVLFDGIARTPSEAAEAFRRRKKADRVMFFEILGLLSMLVGVAALLFALLMALCY